MNYSIEEIGKIIKEERLKKKWTQEQLSKQIGITGKQVSNYEKGVLLPPIDILLKLCDIFECELGYILGEEDYKSKTKLNTIIEKTLGLNPHSLNTLHLITGNERICLNFGYESITYRRILNNILCEPSFIYLLESLYELDSCIKHEEKLYKQLEEKYGDEVLNTAFEYYCSTTDYIHDENAEKLTDIYYQAIADIDTYLSEEYNMSFSRKVNRYEVREAFERLIDNLYPNKSS